MMKKTALLLAVVAGTATVAVSQADARDRYVRTGSEPAATVGLYAVPNVAGAYAYAPQEQYGAVGLEPGYTADGPNSPRPGFNGAASDSYNHYGPAGQLLQRSYPG